MANPSPSAINPNQREDLTTRRIRVIEQRYGEKTLILAYHAAFPLTITSDLLYCLRENFVPDAPWYAVADVLLSGLCESIGYDLYEMEDETRNGLLKKLSKEQWHKLADFMAQYIFNRFTQENNDYRRELIPLSYLMANGEEVKWIKKNLQNLLKSLPEDDTDRVKWKKLEEKYKDLLREEGFEPLLLKETRRTPNQEEQTIAKAMGVELKTLEFEVAFFTEEDEPEEELRSFEFETVTVNARGEVIKREQKQAYYFIEYLGEAPGEPAELGIEMVAIPGGTFVMGSPEDERGHHKGESPQHRVTVQPFFMGKYPVTQAQWRKVAQLPQVNQKLNPEPSRFKGDNLPVEKFTWKDAKEFCDRLSNYTGRTYTLPSEAEWEYACRSVISYQSSVTSKELTVEEWNEQYNQPFHFGETISTELANYNGNYTYGEGVKGEYRQQTTPVGYFKVANNFGLYDMHGNVWEWCEDDWHEDYQGAPTDGSAWRSPRRNTKVVRGGSWSFNPDDCRSAFRDSYSRVGRNIPFGFRVVCVAPRTTK